ncbi:BRCT domain-containing protein, partial [uncultured Mucilaginibacter sp.]|uniref:BRCT domain-containing protein n=1 Tax=uncultured Mucilaginibacter sp. TaxID=797541 RepID=UPI00261594BC
LQHASFTDLILVDEIGDRIAESLIEYFTVPQHMEQIEKLKKAGLQFTVKEEANQLQSEKLSGKSFIISGVFEQFSREELKQMIEQNGGKILGSISSKLDYLVAGENMGPSKLEKAQKLNISMISEQELLELINA